MAQNVNPTPSASHGFDKDAAERGSATSSAQVSFVKIAFWIYFQKAIYNLNKFL